jgi:6-phosphogluconolactonase
MSGLMKNAELKVFTDLEALSLDAAARFTAFALAAVAKNGLFLTAISGGSTPARLFQMLSAPPFSADIPWPKIQFYWCDERCVPPDDDESNYGSANKLLFSKIDLPQANIHRILGELTPAEAVTDYAEKLSRNASPGLHWPRFDLVLLGMGSDGHVASLFPGSISHAELTSPVMTVTAHYDNRPAERVTLTPLVFNSACHIEYMVSGKNKAVPLRSVITESGSPEQLPALRIHPVDGSITWLVDHDTASLLAQPH